MKGRSVALLRSLNVGAHNRISMPDLAKVFEAVGCEDVSTYIQSGNVLFRASAALLKKVPALVEAKLQKDFDVVSPVIIRDAAELAAVLAGNPFLQRGEELSRLHVGFLSAVPDAGLVKALDPKRSPGDEFRVVGRDLFLFLPNGAGKTKLSNAWFDKALGVASTWRNWNTVRALAEQAVAVG